MSNQSYIYLNFGRKDFGLFRYAGPGLCNLLFVWARGIVAAKKYSIPLLAPTWINIKPGAILRGESDKRFYNGLFIPERGNVTGMKKYFLQSSMPSLDEEVLYSENRVRPGCIYVFSGLKDYFKLFADQQVFIRQKLGSIIHPRHNVVFDSAFSVSAHIRLGDFKVSNLQTSIHWFKEKLLQLREVFGNELPCYVFSDGSEEELLDLLRLPFVKKVSFGSSLADLIALSQSNIILGSKSSTFSMWAAFLGQVPTIWPHKDSLVEQMFSAGINGTVSPQNFPLSIDFVELLRKRKK